MSFEKGINMLIGYARVSTNEQNLESQIDLLNQAGCEKIFSDKISGSRKDRPGLQQAISHFRPGDTLIVLKLDRLGRGLKNLIKLVEDLEKKGIHFQSLTEGINTSTPGGKFFFHILGALAQMERELLIERTQIGLKAARKRGRIGGRPRKMTSSKVESAEKLLIQGVPAKEIAKNLNISLPTLYRWCPVG